MSTTLYLFAEGTNGLRGKVERILHVDGWDEASDGQREQIVSEATAEFRESLTVVGWIVE